MPIVRVDFWEGVGEEKIKTMIRSITNVIVDLGTRAHPLEATFMKFLIRTGVSVVNQLQRNLKTYLHPSST